MIQQAPLPQPSACDLYVVLLLVLEAESDLMRNVSVLSSSPIKASPRSPERVAGEGSEALPPVPADGVCYRGSFPSLCWPQELRHELDFPSGSIGDAVDG